MLDRYTNNKDLKAQNLTLVGTSQHTLEPECLMVGHENEFEMMQDQHAREARELEVVLIVWMGALARQPWLTKFIMINSLCLDLKFVQKLLFH
ncbi:hypothetical protein MTR67_003956 [Solanum verrucosum]|uniref:Uncharacterized protein n=1 Tax=Solanum verrucosum TaxID=315347 RepID=A0AAF0PXY8_SOLVR|nr:hypothetical protein MTR67_003956 [Solanum verrucosum]